MTKVSYSKKNSVFLYPLAIKDKTKLFASIFSSGPIIKENMNSCSF